jgi:hypothetical protein
MYVRVWVAFTPIELLNQLPVCHETCYEQYATEVYPKTIAFNFLYNHLM